MILYLFLKAKSRAKAYIIKTVIWCLRNRKDVKKTVHKKIDKSQGQIQSAKKGGDEFL